MALAHELKQDFSGDRGQEQTFTKHLQGVLDLARSGALFAMTNGIGNALIN